MLVLLSFTTETNLISRAARLMSLNSVGGPRNKKFQALTHLRLLLFRVVFQDVEVK